MVEKRQVVIVGGGPAGLAAAIEAANYGAQVLLIDENSRPGGQLFKQIHKFFGSKAHSAGIRGIDIGMKLLKETEDAGVEVWLNSTVIGLYEGKNLSVARGIDNGEKVIATVEAEKILVAIGSQENAIRFEGWTIPGVMGAGCAQTMINVNRVLPGKRALIIGSGNVGLMVGYQLLQAGVEVLGVVEAAPRIGGYGVHAAKIRRAGVPFFIKHTIISAEAQENTLSRAVIAKLDDQWKPIKGTERIFDVDLVCIAAGLRPLTKLTQMYGVRHDYIPELGGWMPDHDENMRTTNPDVYVAGDTAGVEEANTAMDEGRLAGVAIAESLGLVSSKDACDRKNEIRLRLESLRLGPFGERRLNAKKRIVEMVAEQ